MDETYVRVKGECCYLYRAVDSEGATVEFFLSAFRDKESAQSLFRRAIRHGAPPPRVINTDLAPTYLTAIAGLQRSATYRAIAGTGPCSVGKPGKTPPFSFPAAVVDQHVPDAGMPTFEHLVRSGPWGS